MVGDEVPTLEHLAALTDRIRDVRREQALRREQRRLETLRLLSMQEPAVVRDETGVSYSLMLTWARKSPDAIPAATVDFLQGQAKTPLEKAETRTRTSNDDLDLDLEGDTALLEDLDGTSDDDLDALTWLDLDD